MSLEVKGRKKEEKRLRETVERMEEEAQAAHEAATASITALESRAQQVESDMRTLLEHNSLLQSRESSLLTELKKSQRDCSHLQSQLSSARQKQSEIQSEMQAKAVKIDQQLQKLANETVESNAEADRSSVVKARLRVKAISDAWGGARTGPVLPQQSHIIDNYLNSGPKPALQHSPLLLHYLVQFKPEFPH